MKNLELPSQEDLHAILSYNPDTGDLIWKTRPGSHHFNSMFAGKPALSAKRAQGTHLGGTMMGMSVVSHRVIWKMMTGEEPVMIDHRNGDPLDNRWRNLRAANPIINSRNRKLPATNTTGHCNITVCRSFKVPKYIVTICGVYHGSFERSAKGLRRAIERRDKVRQSMGFFSPRHGLPA